MKANPSRPRIWRSQYLQSIELVHGVSKSHSLPRHFHEELELGIRQSDGWQFNYRGAIHSVPPDTLVVTQPGEAHQANSASDQDCTFRGLRVGIDLLQQVATEVAGHKTALPFFPMPLVHDRDLNTQIVQVHQALEQSISGLEQQTLILELLAQLILRCAENPPPQAKLGEERQPVERIRAYLEDHYNQEVSLEQLAQIANLSSFHLNRSFRKTFGMPPHAYQIQVRILQAKRLLTKGWSINKVAAETGFASQSHFGSHFKRLVCVTPRQYIQDSKNLIDFDA
ncbi:AraC family transcriptional regulator [Dendronalium phyllosphericum]|uniref:AraC family transcriptional regulator n=1 Tax=Dendronalium phyllosphericum TaxID=2840445 RepID=UPI001CEC1C52|nr:AraC family transcriptional regulator [Dendronalium phyllosphericum]